MGDAIARPLVEELESGTYDMSSLMSVGNGGAPLSPTIKARLLEQLPNISSPTPWGRPRPGRR